MAENPVEKSVFSLSSPTYLKGALLGLIIILVLSVVLLSLVPPVSKDELVHHLAVPKLYLKHGGMVEIPFMPFSYYPMNLQLLYMIPLYFGNDIVPKLIHFAFALLTALLIYSFLKPRAGCIYALLGALLFLSVPIIVKLSMTAYVDLGLIFFATASLVFLMEWRRSSWRLRYLLLSAVMCGLALGTKHNALIAFFLLSLCVPFTYARNWKGKTVSFRAVKYGLIYVGIALILYSPWMVRNYCWKQNPIYPLQDRLFNRAALTQESRESGSKHPSYFSIRESIYKENWWEIALVPIRVFIEGKDGSPKHFDGKLNPFLIFLPILSFWRRREDLPELRKEKASLLAYVLLFFAFAFFSSDLRIRYISPIIPPLIILSVFGIKKVFGAWKGKARWVAVTAGCLLCTGTLIYNGHYLLTQFKYVDPFSYLSGRVNRDGYIARYRPEHAAMRFINENLPSDALVMFIFLGDRGYYCERDYQFGEGLFGKLAGGARSPEEIYLGIESSGFSHLFIHFDSLNRWIGDNLFQTRLGILNDFFEKHAVMLFHENGFGVFALKPPAPLS